MDMDFLHLHLVRELKETLRSRYRKTQQGERSADDIADNTAVCDVAQNGVETLFRTAGRISPPDTLQYDR
jgi:hypothetical protein